VISSADATRTWSSMAIDVSQRVFARRTRPVAIGGSAIAFGGVARRHPV